MTMHKTIDDFKNFLMIGDGLSSPTRYAVTILPPGGEIKEAQKWKGKPRPGILPGRSLGNIGTIPAVNDTEQFYPENITLPSRSFATIADAYYGPVRQYPYRRQYNSEIVMTLISSENQWERLYLEEWMNVIIDPNNIINPQAVNNLTDNMFIYILSRSDEPTAKFTIDGAYPSSIIPANYGYGMINEYAKFQVTFRYRDYKFELI